MARARNAVPTCGAPGRVYVGGTETGPVRRFWLGATTPVPGFFLLTIGLLLSFFYLNVRLSLLFLVLLFICVMM
jgi:hypothetical protein